jgi:hypothetical protein
MTARDAKRCLAAACAVLLLGLALAGCGCGKRKAKSGAVSQLRQTRLRFAAEERKSACYIVAEVENAGPLAVREVQVTATLRTKTGKTRGLNHTFLRDLKPGEKRVLYMTVATHGAFHRVDLSFHEPGAGR